MHKLMTIILPCVFASAALADTSEWQTQWAQIQYQVENEDQQQKQMDALAQTVRADNAADDESRLWQAIIVSTSAGMDGAGMSALEKAETARDLLLQTEKSADGNIRGLSHMMLGVLYDRVPGWPVGFGDNDKAATYLEKSLEQNPDGMDQNYFYGSYLLDQNQPEKAKASLQKALQAPAPTPINLAYTGRKEDIQKLLNEIEQRDQNPKRRR